MRRGNELKVTRLSASQSYIQNPVSPDEPQSQLEDLHDKARLDHLWTKSRVLAVPCSTCSRKASLASLD